jgi:RimJ/RimL family protein N-acetyltransferase
MARGIVLENVTMLPETLLTDRLRLTTLRAADIPTIVTLASDPLIAAMTLSVPSPYTENDAVQWLAVANREREAGSAFTFALRLPDSDQFMGAVGLHFREQYGHAELGYWMGVPFRGRGYVKEAVGAVIDAGFQHTEVVRIQAIHHDNNPASGRILVANGLKREAVLDSYVIKNGRSQTVVQYRILRSEWEEHAK